MNLEAEEVKTSDNFYNLVEGVSKKSEKKPFVDGPIQFFLKRGTPANIKKINLRIRFSILVQCESFRPSHFFYHMM